MPIIPALGRLRQEDLKFDVNLGYIVRLLSQQNKTTNPHPWCLDQLQTY
jgi:hypothetical protein